MIDFDGIIDAYIGIREQCYKLMRENPHEILGDQEWLRSAISENDINIYTAGDKIHCSGYCRSMQTMDTEWFYFEIPKERIKKTW